MPPKKNTTAAGQPTTPVATPMRQTRARSQLANAPRLMTGLDHRGRPVDPLATDPESIVYHDVVKRLKDRRKKKIILRVNNNPPDSPTNNVKAAQRAQLKKKPAPTLPPASTSSGSGSGSGLPLTSRPLPSNSPGLGSDGGVPLTSQPPPSSSPRSGSDGVPLTSQPPPSSPSSDSDGGVPLTSPSPPSSSSDSDSDGGVPLRSPDSSENGSGPGSGSDSDGEGSFGHRSPSESSSSSDSDGGVPLGRRSSSGSSSSSDSDGGVPLRSRSSSESSSGSDSDGEGSFGSRSRSESSSSSGSDSGAPLSSSSSSSSSGSDSSRGSATHGSATTPRSPHSSNSGGYSSGSEGSSRRSGSPHPSDASSSSSGSGASVGSDNPDWAGQPPLPGPPPQSYKLSLPSSPRPINSPAPFEGDAVDGFEPHAGFLGWLSSSPTRQCPPEEDVIMTDAVEELPTIDMSGSDISVTAPCHQQSASDEDEDEPPRTVSRSTPSSCAIDSFRKRRRSEDDGSASQRPKKVKAAEEELLYSPTYDIPVTEQSDINPCLSPVLRTKIPGLDFLEAQNASIATGKVSPMDLKLDETRADYDSEIPGLHGSGKRPRMHYDWYEQYHKLGPDCKEVHGCKQADGPKTDKDKKEFHGSPCHQCHADWHKDWSIFFKLEDMMEDLADAGMADYDIRKGYLGTALGPEHCDMMAFEPVPPRGGKLRIHPARVAKETLVWLDGRDEKEG